MSISLLLWLLTSLHTSDKIILHWEVHIIQHTVYSTYIQLWIDTNPEANTANQISCRWFAYSVFLFIANKVNLLFQKKKKIAIIPGAFLQY